MKAKRRQELKTNELATALAQLKDWYTQNSTLVWGVALGFVVVLLISTLWYRSSVSRRAENWNRFFTLRQQLMMSLQGEEADPEPAVRELTEMASNAGDANIRNSASLAVAHFEWRRANTPGAPTSDTSLSEARESFKRVIDARKATDVTRLVAKLGQAAVLENAGDMAGAKSLYEDVAGANGAEHTGLAVLAKASLDRLQNPMVTGKFPPKPAPPAPASQPAAADASGTAVGAAETPGDKAPAASFRSMVTTTQPAGEGD